jgi:Flp pilus assembly protein TadD
MLNRGNGGNGHGGASPLVVLSDALLAETLSPSYERDASTVLAPVLELEGLEPWAEIPGPALSLDEATGGGQADPVLVFDDPAQLELEAGGFERESGGQVAEALLTEDEPDEAPAFEPEAPEAIEDDLAGEAVALAMGSPALEEQAAEPDLTPSAPDSEGASVGAVAADEPTAGIAEPAAAVGEEDPPAPVAEAAAQTQAPPEPPQPDPSEVLYGEARDAADAGRVEDAKRLYRELLGLHPTHVRARNNLALLLDAEGNHKAALTELDRALDIDSENGTLLVNRGALLGAMGRYAAAERDLKKVLRVEPSHAEALFNLGVVMTKKGLWAEAVPHLKRAVEMEPQRAAAHYYLGEALNHVDDLTGALVAYQRAAELQPANPRALYGLGIIYDRLARPDDAAQMYRRSREVARR